MQHSEHYKLHINIVLFVPRPCSINAHHISGSRCNALLTCHTAATDSKLQKTPKHYSAAPSTMLDHSSQSKDQKWSQPTWRQNKELYVITLLKVNWSLVIKIACVGKEWNHNKSDIPLVCMTVRRSCQVWLISAVQLSIQAYICTPLHNLSVPISPSESYSSRREAGIIFQCKWHSLRQSTA